MKIQKEDIVHVADLARLELSDGDLDTFATQVSQILDYVDTLEQVDTTGVPPTSHAIELTNAFRDDEVKAHLDRDKALANAPEKETGAFVVPKVVS
jgi:aspartyl-tRNA(Asn)/glutamyl-tRNA(Gln) amidotransferase subunit C